MRVSNNKGFSLIEVLVTVGLIGILVGIAIPSYNGYKTNTVAMALKADLGNGAKVIMPSMRWILLFAFLSVRLVLLWKGRVILFIKSSLFMDLELLHSTDCGSLALTELQYKTKNAGKLYSSSSQD